MSTFKNGKLAAFGLVVVCAACGGGNPAAPGTGAGAITTGDGRVHLVGTVLDGKSGAAVGGSLVVVEIGGPYRSYPDSTKASPFYQFSGITAADGTFDILVPPVSIAIHSYSNDYHYGNGLEVTDPSAGGISISQSPMDPGREKKPTITGFAAPASVQAGADVTFEAMVTHGNDGDPLSDEVIVFEPLGFWAAELDPPGGRMPDNGFPDGRWSRTVKAPTVPGDYTYYLHATSEQCVNSDRAQLVLKVTP